MKITLKYGIAVTAAIAAWVALKHFVLHFEGPSAQVADLFVFNFAAILGLVLGIKANEWWFFDVRRWLENRNRDCSHICDPDESLLLVSSGDRRAEVDAAGRRDQLR